MSCAELERTAALIDGELDAVAAAEAERHLETCAECRALAQEHAAIRTAMRRAPYHRAPEALQRNTLRALNREARPARVKSWFTMQFWAGALGGGFVTAAAAAALTVFLLLPGPAVVENITEAHLRSLAPDHLIDVASSDRHTVKPWFAAHTDVSPPAVELRAKGFTLVGGRADIVDGERGAVVVYRHGAHVINVFAWADRGGWLPGDTTHNGFLMAFWRSGNLDFCAVSDMSRDEFEDFVRLYRGARE